MRRKHIILIIVLLVVGFASIATNLLINGNTKVVYDENNFKSNVVFTKAETLTGTAVINGNEKNIDFESIKLEDINQTTILDFDVANKSREYDSSVIVTCGLKEDFASFNEYLDINMSLPSPFDLLAGETKSGELTVTLKKAYDKSLQTSAELKCTLTATPIERDSKGNEYVKPLYKDKVLNGADPVLDEEGKLVPVKIASDGTVTAADTTEEWYNYTNKEWANAIILNDGVTHTTGDTIPETDIESYFVWIPRYKYQIFDEGNYTTLTEEKPTTSIAKTINIEFESKDTELSTGSTKDSWLTHPAFTNFDVNGIWVGKFETSKNNNQIQIKPNVSSWRNETVKTFFMESLNYNTNLVSHMMKNTEWGAAAYLSHSKYGINAEVRINNNSNYLTGYAAVDGTDQSSYPGTVGTASNITLPYNTATGEKASTTGNITGIYDMSGGAWEYVAAYSGIGSSGFTSTELTTYSTYLDVYSASSNRIQFNKRILGDATGEMGPFYYYNDGDHVSRQHNSWYSDYSIFVEFNHSWFSRGGYFEDGVLAGQFYFNCGNGNIYDSVSSRLVLAI